MGTVIDFNKAIKKAAKREAREARFEQFKEKGMNVLTFIVEHPKEISFIAGGITVLAKFGTSAIKRVNMERSNNLKKRTFWDPRACHHVVANKTLTPKQMKEFDSRRKKGEYVSDILHSFGVY